MASNTRPFGHVHGVRARARALLWRRFHQCRAGATIGDRASGLGERSCSGLEILSPTSKSFDDFNSPELSSRFGGGVRVIPNTNHHDAAVSARSARPVPADPSTNSSKQSLQDANLLALRITYGIPRSKQVPLVGRFYVKALDAGRLWSATMNSSAGLLEEGRIPIVARAVLRMSSEPFEQAAVTVSSGASGGGVCWRSGWWGRNGQWRRIWKWRRRQCGTGEGLPGSGPRCHSGDPHCDPNCGVRLVLHWFEISNVT